MAGQIEAYCNKNQIAPKMANRVQLVFEETMQLLMPMMETTRVQAACEYSEQTEMAEWTFSYAGQRMDVTQSGDELALAVLKGMTKDMTYIWSEEADLPNLLKLKIQQA